MGLNSTPIGFLLNVLRCSRVFVEFNFWFAAPGEDRESLVRGLGEGKLRIINR